LQLGKFSFVKMPFFRFSALSSSHRKALIGSVLLLGAALLLPQKSPLLPHRTPVDLDITRLLSDTTQSANLPALPMAPDFEKVIAKGDTLSGLFEQGGIDQQTMYRVLEADLNILALDTLQPNDQIQIWLDDAGQLKKLTLYFNAARQVTYHRFDDGSFSADETNIEGIWRNRSVVGEIKGSFYRSAQRMGLSAAHIQRVESLLKEKLNFARDLRAGDKFSVLIEDQYVDGVATGASDVLGITIDRGRSSINAYQFTDGNFYDEQGRSLARAFQRIPLTRHYRISSRFNPHRHHPVTGRTSPHNGTDFATPIGTKIIAPGDGIVSLVTDHRYAGKYVVIDHGHKYRTRYLHLSKSLVHKGQRVSRGQVIALSGNTGRITGPHLHYEFHINGRAVDPMKAKIPMASQLSAQQMRTFEQLVKVRKMMMGHA